MIGAMDYTHTKLQFIIPTYKNKCFISPLKKNKPNYETFSLFKKNSKLCLIQISL